MKGSKREKRLAGLALFLALVAVFSLGGFALVLTYGGTNIVSTGRETRSFAATQTNIVWSPWEAIDPTEIYELASQQTVIVEAPVPDMDDAIHAYGAGFLISYDGYIMTNCHVVTKGLQQPQRHTLFRLSTAGKRVSSQGLLKFFCDPFIGLT